MTSTVDWLRDPKLRGARWLFALQCVVLLGVFIGSAVHPFVGHYLIFTTAGRYLFHGQNPYGIEWGYGGVWAYSPTCGWLFGLLALLPKVPGIFLFDLVSHLLLLDGMRRFLRRLPSPEWRTNAYLCWLVILSSGELVGAYQSFKAEMLMLGCVLIAADLADRRPAWAALLASYIASFKFVFLAPVGLVALAFLRARRYRFVAWLGAFLVMWYLLPYVVHGPALASQMLADQNRFLAKFVGEVYLTIPNLFGFLARSLGVKVSLASALGAMGIAAAASALVVLTSCRDEAERLALALSLGCLYTLNFNLLTNLNGYLVALPAVAYTLWLAVRSRGATRLLYVATLFVYWVTVSLVYSDLVPHSFRDLCRYLLVKPVGTLLMSAVLVVRAYAPERAVSVAPAAVPA